MIYQLPGGTYMHCRYMIISASKLSHRLLVSELVKGTKLSCRTNMPFISYF